MAPAGSEGHVLSTRAVGAAHRVGGEGGELPLVQRAPVGQEQPPDAAARGLEGSVEEAKAA